MTSIITFTNWLILSVLLSQPLLSQNDRSAAKCDLPPVQNFTCVLTNTSTILLMWEAPQFEQHILRWDDGYNYTGLGLNDGGTFMAGARWDAEQLTPYQNWYLTHIAFFPTTAEATFTVQVWFNETLNASQPVISLNANAWNIIELNTPVQISGLQVLMIGYEVTHSAGIYPAGCDAGPAVPGYGDIVTGGTLSGFGIDYNWNLAGYISPEATGQKAVLKHQPYSKSTLLGYNIYQNDELIATLSPFDTSFIDFVMPGAVLEFVIGAVYNECTAMSDTCIPAPVSIEEVYQPSFSIYPNPASGLFNISGSANIAKLSVFNAFGVEVYRGEQALPAQVDLTKHPKGVYLIRIVEEERYFFMKMINN
jgi:hypothetical protein